MTGTTPEQRARANIDRLLEQAGWSLQGVVALNPFASRGVAVREFPLRHGHGFADYLLYVDGRAAGVVEAKPAGHTLTGVESQSGKYGDGLPDTLPYYVRPCRSCTTALALRPGSPTASIPSRAAGTSSHSIRRRLLRSGWEHPYRRGNLDNGKSPVPRQAIRRLTACGEGWPRCRRWTAPTSGRCRRRPYATRRTLPRRLQNNPTKNSRTANAVSSYTCNAAALLHLLPSVITSVVHDHAAPVVNVQRKGPR